MTDRETNLTPTSVELAVGPVLYGIALRQDDPGQVFAAVELASRYWGGISFPWLPLQEDGTIIGGAEKLCSVLDVAGIVDLTREDDRDPVPVGLQALGVPVTPRRKRPKWAMPIRGAVIPEEDLELIAADEEPEDGDLDLVELVALGIIGHKEYSAWEEVGQSVYLRGNELALAQLRPTAISITAMGIDTFTAEEEFPTTVALVWVLPDTFTLPEIASDLTTFWNSRALRRWGQRTVTVIARKSSLLESSDMSYLRADIAGTAFSTPMCVFNGLAVAEADLKATAEALGFHVTESSEWHERHNRQPKPLERTAAINFPITDFWMKERHSGTSKDVLAVAHRPRWKARIESPLKWRYPEAHAGLVSAKITSPVITGPRTDTVAALYQQNARWRSGGVRIFTKAMPTYHLDLGMPHPAEVLEAALQARGRRFTVSDKGREIDGILAACDDLALFRRPAFHAVTAALTPQPSPRIEKKLSQLSSLIAHGPEAAAIADELRDITARARAKPPTLNDLVGHKAVRDQKLGRSDVTSVLADMLARGLARWGYERRCDLCGLIELVPLASATPVPQCAGCGRDATYMRRNDEPVLHYALGGLLQRVSRNSGLTPLAAAAALRQEGYYVVPGATIIGGTGAPDTDLLACNGRHLLAGEAKAAATLFDPDKLATEISEAAGMGATRYLITCPEAIPNEVLASALTIAQKHGIELLQLAGKALMSGMPTTHAVLPYTEKQNDAVEHSESSVGLDPSDN
jgi:hypothetical protein